MKYLLLSLLMLMCSNGYGAEMEISNYNKFSSNHNLFENIPIAFIFDEKNKASHFQLIEKKPGEYLIISKELVAVWIKDGTNKFMKDFKLEDLIQFIQDKETKSDLYAMKKNKVKHKIVFFNAWFEILNQYPKLVANKEKRLELFTTISAEENDIQILEIELQDKLKTMSPY